MYQWGLINVNHIISYHIICHISYLIYQISYLIYHISNIIYHLSSIIYHLSYIIYHINLFWGYPTNSHVASVFPTPNPAHFGVTSVSERLAVEGVEAPSNASSFLQWGKWIFHGILNGILWDFMVV